MRSLRLRVSARTVFFARRREGVRFTRRRGGADLRIAAVVKAEHWDRTLCVFASSRENPSPAQRRSPQGARITASQAPISAPPRENLHSRRDAETQRCETPPHDYPADNRRGPFNR